MAFSTLLESTRFRNIVYTPLMYSIEIASTIPDNAVALEPAHATTGGHARSAACRAVDPAGAQGLAARYQVH